MADSRQPAASNNHLLDLCLRREKLQKQKLDACIALNEASVTDDELGRDEEQLEQLREEHESTLAHRFASNCAIQRMQLTTEALQSMFPDYMDPDNDQDLLQLSAKSRRLQDLMAQQKSIITDIQNIRNNILTQKEVYHELRQRNQEIRQQNRQLMFDIKEARLNHKTPKHNQQVNQATDDLQNEMDRITVLRNVFQLLIVGSGINWAQDPEMLDLVVHLSEQPALDS